MEQWALSGVGCGLSRHVHTFIFCSGKTVGTIADRAEEVQEITVSHHFVPIAIETSGVLGAKAHSYWNWVGASSRRRERAMHNLYLLHRISVALQWENEASVVGSSDVADSDLMCMVREICFFFVTIFILFFN